MPQNGHLTVIVLLLQARTLARVNNVKNKRAIPSSDSGFPGARGIIVESYPARSAALRLTLVSETFPPEVNGVAMTWGHLTRNLAQLGHSVQVVRPRQLCEESSVNAREQDQVLTSGFPIPSYPELRFGMITTGRLTELWKRRRPDVAKLRGQVSILFV